MTKKIKLTRGFEAIIDDEDFIRVSRYKWRVTSGKWGTYAVTWVRIEGKGRHVYLHRFLLGFPADKLITFANGDRLDCRRENLKFTTRSKSQMGKLRSTGNRTGFKGVSFNKAAEKFKAYIKKDGKLHYLGLYATAKEAAAAYNKKAKELFGEFAGLNKI
jgi:hypothetical protein